jgi:N4-gp56 family major capsid protein
MPSSLANQFDAPNLQAAFSAAKLVPEIFSKEIELKTLELGYTRFRDFVVVKEELGKNPGDRVHIPKIGDLRKAQALDQSKVLRGSGQSIQGAYVTLTPTEHGDELQMTEYSNLTSQTELDNLMKELLARQALKTENFKIRDVMFGATANRRFANGVSAQASVAADLDSVDIDFVVERLEKNEAMKWPGEAYVSFIHPYGKTDIVQDLVGTNAYALAVGGALYKGEVGLYNRTRFVESAYVPMKAYSSVGITGATGGVVVASASGYTLEATLCEGEVVTLTYTASGDSWAFSGSVSGTRTAALFTAGEDPNDPTKKPVQSGLATVTDTQFTTYDIALEVKDEDGLLLGYDVVFDAAAVSGAASDGVATLTIILHTQTAIFGMRHICWGIIRNVNMLGMEMWDYGRVKGIAWNAFWDCKFLFKNYGYVIEALHS